MTDVLETRALQALYRNHPQTLPENRWGWRAKAAIRQKREMLLAWAAAMEDEELLWFRNLGVASLAWIRANQPTWPPLAIEREASALDVERLARAIHASNDHDNRPGCLDMDRESALLLARAYAVLDLTSGVSSTQHG